MDLNDPILSKNQKIMLQSFGSLAFFNLLCSAFSKKKEERNNT